MNGKLYLCATPIGNLGDVSARCLEAFNNADLIAAEDTRRTLQLLNHFEISKPLTSYHEPCHGIAQKAFNFACVKSDIRLRIAFEPRWRNSSEALF